MQSVLAGLEALLRQEEQLLGSFALLLSDSLGLPTQLNPNHLQLFFYVTLQINCQNLAN